MLVCTTVIKPDCTEALRRNTTAKARYTAVAGCGAMTEPCSVTELSTIAEHEMRMLVSMPCSLRLS